MSNNAQEDTKTILPHIEELKTHLNWASISSSSKKGNLQTKWHASESKNRRPTNKRPEQWTKNEKIK